MCWNIQVSAASATFGLAVSFYLSQRGRPRDAFYARYLTTFTFTQMIDMVLWYHHDNVPGGLQACVPFQQQFGSAPEGAQYSNFVITKFLLPLVVFSQHAMQLTYPSKRFQNQRMQLILAHTVPIVFMSFAFACTTLYPGNFPWPAESLLWGGDFSTWPFSLIQAAALLHSGLVAFDFWLLMRDDIRVLLAHLVPLYSVIATLALTEGTIMLGSKWCTYCLIYCFVYLSEPLWHVESKQHASGDTLNKEKRG